MDRASGFVGSSIGSSLLLQVRAHDPLAWQRIVFVYGPLIYRWCRAAGIQDAAAADVGQEVFRAVATGIHGFRRDKPGDTFVGWLRQITRFKIADYQRQATKDPVAHGGSEFLDFIHDLPAVDHTPPSSPTIQGERAIVLARALEILKRDFQPQTWQAFWGTTVDGRETKDVADEMKMTATAVRKAKSRVLRRLRDEFMDVVDLDN